VENCGLISVIVPVYRVEKYLEECIDSIIGQTYPFLEVILVDDGSPDGCGAICDRYAQKDPRVIVVHQRNSGAAAARNAALRLATGACIAFVDSDDYLEPDAYEKLMEGMLRWDADIVQGKLRNVYVNGSEIIFGGGETVCFSAEAYLARFTGDWTCALSPDKLFRRHVLEDVFYEEGHLIDDEFFTYQAVMNAGKIVCIPDVVYNYRQRASSVMKSRDTAGRKVADIFDYLEKRHRRVTDRFPALKSLYEGYYADHLIWLTTSDLATEQTIPAIKKRLLAQMTGGKIVPWKKGQRKRGLRILATLLKPAGIMLRHRKGGIQDGEHQLFE
jgi:glycosyltransferase involved in cell wall biosynthesis